MSQPTSPTASSPTKDLSSNVSPTGILPFKPVVCIVDFHHARGPEVERWIGIDESNPITDWPLLPFMALSDGAHAAEEDYSYFSLRHELVRPDEKKEEEKEEKEEKKEETPKEEGENTEDTPGAEEPVTTPITPIRPPSPSKPAHIPTATTLFGLACTRQLDAKLLLNRSDEVTRSTVQKAVVVIMSSPVGFFGGIREKLGMVTRAWFAQRDFEDMEVIEKFRESLLKEEEEEGPLVGLSLRELVFAFREKTLVLFKALLLQPKMIFFGSKCEKLCLTQFALLSLVPGLLKNLQDAADPELANYEERLTKPSSVRTADRKSLLNFMGMPLQLFGRGSLFGPYTPLQQLDLLASSSTHSYVVGSTNSLLLQQKDRYSDILINLDELSINITSPSLRNATYLSAADRRWIDSIVSAVVETWDESDPSRPKSMGFLGSEDYIRLQFEEYMLSLVSSVKYHLFLSKHSSNPAMLLSEVEGDPSADFGTEWVERWKQTDNYRLFMKATDEELFDLVSPKHVMAGGLTVEDVQRRLQAQIADLKLDEKTAATREALGRTFNAGKGRVSSAFGALAKNVETLRERRAANASTPTSPNSRPQSLRDTDNISLSSLTPTTTTTNATSPADPNSLNSRLSITPISSPGPSPGPGAATGPTSPIGPAIAEAGTRASAYFSSWASWAGEKRRGLKIPGRNSNAPTPVSSPPPSRPGSILSPTIPGWRTKEVELQDRGDVESLKSARSRRMSEEERRLEEEAAELDREMRKLRELEEQKDREREEAKKAEEAEKKRLEEEARREVENLKEELVKEEKEEEKRLSMASIKKALSRPSSLAPAPSVAVKEVKMDERETFPGASA